MTGREVPVNEVRSFWEAWGRLYDVAYGTGATVTEACAYANRWATR